MIAQELTQGKLLPLIHTVDEDDLILLNSPDADWYRILYHFPWRSYREIAATYYESLYMFNVRQAQERQERQRGELKRNTETRREAALRLLFDRATMQRSTEARMHVLYESTDPETSIRPVDPRSIAPGCVPERWVGKRPKCFFSMFKAFVGTSLMGFSPEPERVHQLLTTNPSFRRVCGFAAKSLHDEYCHKHVPSLRKLEQYDQIMTASSLWERARVDEVRRNIESGVIGMENEIVGDTTHYHAFSGFETVEFTDERGKERKKSQSKVTKKCRCADQETCGHPWELADDGAGTVVKSSNKKHWSHKASVVGFPRQGIPLDVRAVSDASTHDGETILPHVKKLFDTFPELRPYVDTALYDSACDSRRLKESFSDELGMGLKVSLNPRRRKNVTEGLPRGMDHITPYGVPYCRAGFEMEYKGIRYDGEKFIYHAPDDDDGIPVCFSCEHKMDCCPHASTGRTITVSFDMLPHIDANDPPMAKRFKAIMSRRTSVERMIKRLKRDLGDDRLSKRGNASFQAYLDKTLLAFHMLLRN